MREGQPGLRILLAEDNLVNQKLVVLLLEKAGHSISVASDGLEVLNVLESQPFDVIIMDVQMPNMDGLKATELIRARENTTGSHIPIVAITAHAMQEDREHCLAAGMDGYVTKPIMVEELFAELERLIPSTPRAAGAATGHRAIASRISAMIFGHC